MRERIAEKAFVISPHQDDAVLSIGAHLQNYGSVDVVNLFTRSNSHILPDLSEDIEEVSHVRLREDESISAVYGFTFHNADFADSEVRGVAWDDQWSEIDQGLVDASTEFIQKTMSTGDVDIFVPAAFGVHPDHLIAHMAAIKMLGSIGLDSWYLYADQPYYSERQNVRLTVHDQLTHNRRIVLPFSMEQKNKMLHHYPSQLSPERVDHMSKIGAEYVWAGTDDILHRAKSGERYERKNSIFGSRTWHDTAAKNMSGYRHVTCDATLESGNTIAIPFMVSAMNIDSSQLAVARLNGAGWLDYADFENSQLVDSTAWNEVKNQLQKTGADVLWISGLKEDTRLYQVIEGLQSDGYLFTAESSFVLDCSSTGYNDWQNGLSARMRSKLRRIERKREAFLESGGNIEIRSASSEDIVDFLNLQRCRAEASDGALEAFGDDTDYSGFLTGLADFGELKIVKMITSDRQIGSMLFHYDEEQDTVLSIINQGFDPEYANFSPGFIMQRELIILAHEQGARAVDYLKGDEPYKREFANREVGLYKFIQPLRTFTDDEWKKIQAFGRTYVE